MPTFTDDNSSNLLTGTTVSDLLSGLGGNDTLAGLGGSDTLDGCNGSDLADFSWSTTDVSVDLIAGTEFNENVTLIDIEHVTGGSTDDVLLGNAGGNQLDGGAGGDSLDGRGGDDTLVGAAGADALNGGDGTDQARYDLAAAAVAIDLATGIATGGAGSDTLTSIENAAGSAFGDMLDGTTGANSLQGLGGDDTLAGLGGFDTMDGGDGSDLADFSWSAADVSVDLVAGVEFNENVTLIDIEHANGGSADDVLLGDAGGNQLDGGNGGDSLDGLGGDDTLIGGAGSDALNGGNGSDQARYDLATAAVTIDLAAGTATGGAGSDTLTSIEVIIGSGFADIISGKVDTQFLFGGDGNDTLSGAMTNETLHGGAGTDTVTYEAADHAIIVNLFTGGTFAPDFQALISVENVVGTAFNDFIFGNSGNNLLIGGDASDTLLGGGGIDTLDGGAGLDLADFAWSTTDVSVDLAAGLEFNANVTLVSLEHVIGSSADDVLRGDGLRNWLDGRAGDDATEGRDGNDSLTGGDGNDTLNGGDGRDEARYDAALSAVTVDLAAGSASGGAGNDLLVSIESVIGSAFNDNITGGLSGNYLFGGAGNDTLLGGAGTDTLIGGAGNDSIVGSGGLDLVSYMQASGPVTVNLATGTATGDGTDTIEAVAGVLGSVSNDSITGDDGANFLLGNLGNDTLNGGAGSDTLVGGAGSDLFVFGFGYGVDIIDDYAVGIDHMRIVQAGFTQPMSVFAEGTNTVVSFGGGNRFFLVGIDVASITPSDFIMV